MMAHRKLTSALFVLMRRRTLLTYLSTDGVTFTSTQFGANILNAQDNVVFLGARHKYPSGTNQNWQGYISNPRIWSTVLSQVRLNESLNLVTLSRINSVQRRCPTHW